MTDLENIKMIESTKRKVSPMIEAILDIEDLLMVSDLQWTISYYPNSKAYNIYISEPTESKDE